MVQNNTAGNIPDLVKSHNWCRRAYIGVVFVKFQLVPGEVPVPVGCYSALGPSSVMAYTTLPSSLNVMPYI